MDLGETRRKLFSILHEICIRAGRGCRRRTLSRPTAMDGLLGGRTRERVATARPFHKALDKQGHGATLGVERQQPHS
jgi:hypothetical protein